LESATQVAFNFHQVRRAIALIAKEIETAEQFVGASYTQRAKLKNRHIISHVHIERHQFFCSQRMPSTESAS